MGTKLRDERERERERGGREREAAQLGLLIHFFICQGLWHNCNL